MFELVNKNKIVNTIKNISLILGLCLLITACNKSNKKDYTSLKTNLPKATFVGSKSCLACHKKEYNSWKGSNHQQAMQIADSTTILGNFNKSTFVHKNVKSTFFKKDGNYFVNTKGHNGKYQDFKIAYTFGVTPLQQYIIKFPKGSYQCLLTAWDSKKNKWFQLQPDSAIKPDEWFHWTGGAMKWNTMCADCHSTNLQKNFNSETNSYKTTYSEINVSCEACHGPSSLHVDYYKKQSKGKNPPVLYMNPSLNSKDLVDKCARCHSRRTQLTNYFDYKGRFFDHYSPSLLTDPIYELDGQIKGEDYVYGSFVQSKMYHNGVSCKDCHNVHTLKLKKTGNNLCLTCHKPKYNTTEHYFHKLNTAGSQCVNCHMPGKNYMGNDFRRDHSFRVPRPDQTVKYGVPNACNNCHKNKSAKWASDVVIDKKGSTRADHFSDFLLKGYAGDKTSFKKLFSNIRYPKIIRATAINQYANKPLTQNELNDLLMLLKDSSALVRREVINLYEKQNVRRIANHIKPLLKDSMRMVRIAAARYFNIIPQDLSSDKDFKNANNDYLTELNVNADFASDQHQIGIYQQSKGQIYLAIKAYKKALEIDNYYNLSRMNLALIYYQQGQVATSEKLYLKVIQQEPEFSYAYNMVGLLYNEIGQKQKAKKYLDLACKKQPKIMKAFYNYALLLQQENKNLESIKVLESGLKSFPDNENLLYVRLIGEINLKLINKSINTCNLLLKLNPNNANYLKILDDLKNYQQ